METATPQLVSLVTPCYNGVRFIAQWAACLAAQTYPRMEIIFVNDGSTDDTKGIFQRESAQLEARGYAVRYVEKANGGPADAVNHGLKLVSGTYLTLYDVDDILMPEAIAVKAEYLAAHPDVDLVRHSGYMVREHNLDDESLLFWDGSDKENPHILEDILNMRLLPYAGSYMLRTDALFRHLTNRDIYVSPYGQNFQMLIPVACFGKAAFIDRPLMKYINYTSSHCHTQSFERRLTLYNGFEENAVVVLRSLELPQEEKNKYIQMVTNANYEGRLVIGINFKKRPLIRQQYALMKQNGLVTPRVSGMLVLSHLPMGCFVITSWPRLKRVSKRLVYRVFKKSARVTPPHSSVW